MENLEIISLRKERNELSNKYDSAMRVLAELLDCGTRDVDCIMDMETDHEGTIERAKELEDDIGGPLNFGHFVMAVKEIAMDEVEDELEEICDEYELDFERFRDAIGDMIIDDNYCAWGGVANYGHYKGNYENEAEELQNAFADFVTGLDKWEFLAEVRRIFKDIADQIKEGDKDVSEDD